MPERVFSSKANSDEIDAVVSRLRSRDGLIVVVSAPSGAGKTTVCKKVAAEDSNVVKSVSVTTRPRRKTERDGVHYYFVSRKKFLEELEKGRFLEWAQVHGYLYATPRDFLEKQIRDGRDIVLDIDVQGARAVKKAFPEAVLVFLLPPSLAVLERRLRGRCSESPEDIRTRLRNTAAEFSCYPTYDYVVVNDNVDRAACDLRAIINAEKCRVHRLKQES